MKKIKGIFIILMLVLLTGCGKAESVKTAEAGSTAETEPSKLYFYEIEDSFTLTTSENSSECHVFEDKVYSLEFDVTDGDYSVYYLKSYDRNGETKEYRSDDFSQLSWKRWCLARSDEGLILSILSRSADNHYFIERVNLDSLEAETIMVEDDMFIKKTIQNIEATPDNKYIFDTYEYLYFISEKGKMEQCTYKEEGYNLFSSDKEPRLQKGQMLYSYDTETWVPEPVCSLSDSRIRKEDVVDISLWKDKYYVLTEEDEGLKVNILVENRDVVKEEKIQLLLFQPFVRVISQEEIDEFNFENDKYEVILDPVSSDIQFRFLHEDKPDILCLLGYEALALPDYGQAGYIQDLYPFIDKSEIVKRDDLIESMTRGLETNGKLYGISEKVTFQTPFIYDDVDTSGYNAKTAIDMYVRTAKEHDLSGFWSVDSLQELVFTGLMDDILTDETGNRGFNAVLVKEMLEAMKNSGADITRVDALTKSADDRDYYFGTRNRIEDIADVSEYIDGYKLKITGYPSLDGDPVFLQGYSTIMAISTSCKDPEGAFEFIEYMMTRSQLYGNQEGSLFCLKSLNKKGRYPGTLKHYTELLPLTAVVGGEEYEVKNPDEKFEFLQYMSEHVVFETMDFWNVSDIISEEAVPYFRNEKDIDDVMRIIESRVNLMLEENK